MTESEEIKKRLAEITCLETENRKLLVDQRILEVNHDDKEEFSVILSNGVRLTVTDIQRMKI